MKILKYDQIREADAYTIKNEPIAPIDLMERAALGITDWITEKYDISKKFAIFIGPGNNGGDGLVVARLLSGQNYHVEVYLINFTRNFSDDYKINKSRLEKQKKCRIIEIANIEQVPELNEETIVIDALFGSGLTRPLKGLPAEVVEHINTSKEIIAIDIPSGLFGEENFKADEEQTIVKAKYTLTFQFPKLSFLFPENEQFVGEWNVILIGLHPDFIKNAYSNYEIITEKQIKALLKRRKKFAHKGNFGHSLLISGSYGKMGAAVLASKACLRSGVGLHTAHVPGLGYSIIQAASPETMVSIDYSREIFSRIVPESDFDAIGIGPGIGVHLNTVKAFSKLLDNYKKPMVVDADALNILAANKKLMEKIPANSILTPHPKEFERLFGKTGNNFQRLQLQQEMAKKYNIIIVLKGAYTTTVTPDRNCYFNSTGNPGMATAGSGDVLTGIILSLRAQGYEPKNAAVMGVYIHGFAGDIALEEQSEESLIANDIIENLSHAFNLLKK